MYDLNVLGGQNMKAQPIYLCIFALRPRNLGCCETWCSRVWRNDGSSKGTNHGQVDNFSNKNGTLQKDWTIIKSNELSDAFCIAVRGHKGWGSLFKAKYSLVVSFEAIEQNVPIYEPIRTAMEVEIENSEIELELSSNEE